MSKVVSIIFGRKESSSIKRKSKDSILLPKRKLFKPGNYKFASNIDDHKNEIQSFDSSLDNNHQTNGRLNSKLKKGQVTSMEIFLKEKIMGKSTTDLVYQIIKQMKIS